MKKQFLLVTVFLFAITSVFAQESTFNKGDKALNLSLGLGSTLYVGSYYSSKIPPISASLEFGAVDDLFDVEGLNLGVGGYIGYASARYEASWYGGSYGWDYTNFILGARGSLHYPAVEKLDTYAGFMLGYRIVSAKEFGDWSGGTLLNASTSTLASAFYVGGRYYFSNNFAALAELGYGIAYLNLGITLKF